MSSGADAVGQWDKPQPVTPISFEVPVGVPDAPLLIQLSANVPDKSVECGPRAWAPATCMRDRMEF